MSNGEVYHPGKICSKCKQLKPLTEFPLSNGKPHSWCKLCSKYWRDVETKKRVFDHYGGARCACCGEEEFLFLTIDHINNDGNVYRKKQKEKRKLPGGTKLLRDLIRDNFPPGIQVLCYNCNCSKHANGGICAHLKPFPKAFLTAPPGKASADIKAPNTLNKRQGHHGQSILSDEGAS